MMKDGDRIVKMCSLASTNLNSVLLEINQASKPIPVILNKQRNPVSIFSNALLNTRKYL